MDLYDRTMAILLRGVFVGIKHAARVLIAQGQGGAIINTASTAGVQGGQGPHVYSAAKAGRHRPDPVGLGRARPVRHPRERRRAGRHPDAAHRGGDRRATPTTSTAASAAIGSRSPLKRPPTPFDVAEAVLFLASDGGQLRERPDDRDRRRASPPAPTRATASTPPTKHYTGASEKA